MAVNIKIRPANGTWSIRAGGAVIGETSNALEFVEGDGDPVIYFPRSDVAMAFLDPSESRTHHPHKGDASYFSVITKSEVIRDAAWSYENPSAEATEIAGHLAFASAKIAVEQI